MTYLQDNFQLNWLNICRDNRQGKYNLSPAHGMVVRQTPSPGIGLIGVINWSQLI